MEDIDMCEKILDPNIYTLTGKPVRNKPKAVMNYYLYMPQELNDKHQNIEIFADIMYIKGNMFLITVSKKV